MNLWCNACVAEITGSRREKLSKIIIISTYRQYNRTKRLTLKINIKNKVSVPILKTALKKDLVVSTF